MKIETTNAHVDALVNLSNNSTGLRRNTFLEIFSWDGCVHLIGSFTSDSNAHFVPHNSTITSAVNLDDGGNRTANGSDKKFHVRTVGSNGQVKLDFLTQPLGSELVVDAMTTNAAVDVGLHPAFDGNFLLRTRNAPSAVLDEKATDPSGRGRERHLDYQKTDQGDSEMIVGKASWDDNLRGKTMQFAHLQSTNAPVILTFIDV